MVANLHNWNPTFEVGKFIRTDIEQLGLLKQAE